MSDRKKKVLAVTREYKIRTSWIKAYSGLGITVIDTNIFAAKTEMSDYYYTRIARAINRIVKALGYREVPLEIIPEMDFLITSMENYGIPERVLLRQLRSNKYKLKQTFKSGVFTEKDYAAMITAINQIIEKGGMQYGYD